MGTKLISYIMLDGNAREAIDFYQKALDAELYGIQTFGEMPENPEFTMPEAAKELVSHAMIKVGDSELMFSDAFPGHSPERGNQVQICISSADVAQSQKFFDALKEGGTVIMPLAETFFSPAYGMVTDKFGVTFQLYTEGKEEC
ncbi:VOC family protein [Thermoactinomyces sp. DSM 45892]|uniref:VOC family protein n=1 Tax=Thermoactinomyces sp. DSM 45892 TaxID=1882753 RepID=UPI000898EFA3|nr:VOC family protein [Thermoactinomyces sp. DSM 45892]SDY16882.1 PhnB protein [Thermoactinomyces sp. DSM 45892]